MNILKSLFLILVSGITLGCQVNENEKFDSILNSQDIFIQKNTYGGLIGYQSNYFHLKQGQYEPLLIINEGTDYQTFIRMENKNELFKSFLKVAYQTNTPNKEMHTTCIGGYDSEYIIVAGYTSLKLKPDRACDSIFNLIIHP